MSTADQHVDPRPGVVDPDGLAGELDRAVNGLRPEYRLVFILYHEQNLSYEDIARSVDRPVGTVKTWLHRAAPSWPNNLPAVGWDVDKHGLVVPPRGKTACSPALYRRSILS